MKHIILTCMVVAGLATAFPVRAEEPPLGRTQQGNGSGWQWILLPAPDGGRDLTVWGDSDEGSLIAGRYDLSSCSFQDNDPLDGIRGYRLPGQVWGVIGAVCHDEGGEQQRAMVFNPAVDAAHPVAALSGNIRAGLERRGSRIVVVAESVSGDDPGTGTETLSGPDRREKVWPLDDEALLQVAGFQPFTPEQVPPPRINWRRDELRFIARLETIIRNRDLIALRDLLDDDVLSSFGGNGGIAEFFDVWGLNENPAQSDLWPLLDELLSEGPSIAPNAGAGAAGPGEPRPLVFPYVFQAFPDDRDAFAYGVVMGVDVPLRATPSRTSRIQDRLSHALVYHLGRVAAVDGSGTEWVLVAGPQGTTGYVPSDHFASPVGYRALFIPGPVGYRMTHLVAGD